MKKLVQLFLLMVFCTLPAMAQSTFVYTNNDRTPNTISGFSAAADGVLARVDVGGVGAAAVAIQRTATQPFQGCVFEK